MENYEIMSQSKLFSDELEKFIDQEFAKLKREVTEAFAKYRQQQDKQPVETDAG